MILSSGFSGIFTKKPNPNPKSQILKINSRSQILKVNPKSKSQILGILGFIADPWLGCPVSGPTDSWSPRDTESCWANLKSLMMTKKENLFPDCDEALFDELIHPKKEVVLNPTENIANMKSYLNLAFSSKIHPLGYLMSILGTKTL